MKEKRPQSGSLRKAEDSASLLGAGRAQYRNWTAPRRLTAARKESAPKRPAQKNHAQLAQMSNSGVKEKYITLHEQIHYIAPYCCALHYIAVRRMALPCLTWHRGALGCVALRCVAAMRCVASHCDALRCIALHRLTVHCLTFR